VKPPDAAQLRRHLEDGMSLDELIKLGEKAWASKEFWALQSHRLATFISNYGIIQEEVSRIGAVNKPGVDRNAGTANAKFIGQYDNIGKVI
jgi:hypothetical protein